MTKNPYEAPKNSSDRIPPGPPDQERPGESKNLPDEVPEGLSPYEATVLWHGGGWFFFVLFGYYILRPIREQISATYGTEDLSKLFWATFVAMLIAIPAYSFLVGKVHRRRLVPSVYVFFISNLILFWAAMRFGSAAMQIWVDRAFFVWISVYGLFIVSFFWSVIGDMLTTGQGRKYFGYMAGGGTIGGLIGSQVASRLAVPLGVANLLLIPAFLLTAALLIYVLLERSAAARANHIIVKKSGQATGGNPFAGFTAVFKSRYLLAICCYGLFLATCGTTVYFQQSEIVNSAFASLSKEASEAAKTKYFADINFNVSCLTLVLQFLVVGFLMKRTGLGWTLAVLPVAYIGGITALALSPTIETLAIVAVIGRAAEYGVANPAREVLFTSVKREDRYKAKSFIDTIVRRGGDTTVGSMYQGLRETAGLAMSTLSWIVIPIAIVWTGLALFIGFENKKVVAEIEAKEIS